MSEEQAICNARPGDQLSSSTFVYPIRSLWSGNDIQPASRRAGGFTTDIQTQNPDDILPPMDANEEHAFPIRLAAFPLRSVGAPRALSGDPAMAPPLPHLNAKSLQDDESDTTSGSSHTLDSMLGWTRSIASSCSTDGSRAQSTFAPEDNQDWGPSAEDMESTSNHAKPIPTLEMLRRVSSTGSNPVPDAGSTSRRQRGRSTSVGVAVMDIFSVLTLSWDHERSNAVQSGHGVSFDDVWNGEVVVELVNWSHSHDFHKGLHFPTSDTPAKARELYTINTVRILYDRNQPLELSSSTSPT
ncbi:hypothetical protein F5I97DRAFT_1928565 [Phlebopus sp. FC_14]|nr:hypothetical protein F5I97DRAFT_1928565 [Phlebopus sp. FC_14]